MYHPLIPGRRRAGPGEGYLAIMADELSLVVQTLAAPTAPAPPVTTERSVRVVVRVFARAYGLAGYDRTTIGALAAMCAGARGAGGPGVRRRVARWAASERDALYN